MPPRKSAAQRDDTLELEPGDKVPEAVEPVAAAVEAEEDQPGDRGAREAEVSAAQAEFDALHESLNLLADGKGAVVASGVAFVVDMFKHRPKPWNAMGQAEQQDLISGIEENVHELVRQVVEAVVRGTDSDAVRCLFNGFTDKGADIKAELVVKTQSKEETERAILALHRARGKFVMVRVATAEDFHEEAAEDVSEPEQAALGFAGGAPHPEDDSDLVEAGGDQPGPFEPRPPLPEDTTEVVRTGDQLIMARQGLCEARINLKSGMLEALMPGVDRNLDASWFDVREASPAELAQERERIADFTEEEEEETAEAEA